MVAAFFCPLNVSFLLKTHLNILSHLEVHYVVFMKFCCGDSYRLVDMFTDLGTGIV